MTGWSTLTVDPISYEEYDDHGWPDERLQERLLGEADERDLWMWTARKNGHIIARISGYRDWEEDYELLSNVIDLFERAAIVHANDTTDIGTAKMLHRRSADYSMGTPEIVAGDYSLVVKDTYAETQQEDGCQVGEKAASVMHAQHDIPAVSRPRAYRSIEKSYD